MFDTERVGMRVANIQHRTMERDEKEIGLVELTMEINPLTPALAQELDPFMRGTLFTKNDAAVTPKLAGAEFDLSVPEQEIAVHSAPGQTDATFIIDEAKIGIVKARRSKRSTGWRLRFTITFMPTSEHLLAQVVDSYLKSRYLTFASAEPSLFAPSTKQRTKAVRAERAQGIGTDAAATH